MRELHVTASDRYGAGQQSEAGVASVLSRRHLRHGRRVYNDGDIG